MPQKSLWWVWVVKTHKTSSWTLAVKFYMQLSSLKFLSFVFGCKNHSRVFVLSSSIHESTWRRRRFIFLSTEGHHKKHLVGDVLTDGRLSFSKLTTPFCAVGLALRKNICEKSGSSSKTKTVNKKFRYPRIFRPLLRLRMIKVHGAQAPDDHGAARVWLQYHFVDVCGPVPPQFDSDWQY